MAISRFKGSSDDSNVQSLGTTELTSKQSLIEVKYQNHRSSKQVGEPEPKFWFTTLWRVQPFLRKSDEGFPCEDLKKISYDSDTYSRNSLTRVTSVIGIIEGEH